MDASIATAIIVSLTGIVTVYLTNLYNLKQNDASLKSRLTETAFNARLQAFSDLSTAMHEVCILIGRMDVILDDALDYERDKNGSRQNPIFKPGMESAPVPPEILGPLNKSAKTYLDVYYRVRMYLTPEMDEIATWFADYCGLPMIETPYQITYVMAMRDLVFAFNGTERGGDPTNQLDNLTDQMREYITAVEKGR